MPRTDDQIANLDAELDALASSSTTDEVYVATKDYDPDVVAASAARRTLTGGGAALPDGASVPIVIGITLTAAEVRGMEASPITLVAAQGANTSIVVTNAVLLTAGNSFSDGNDVKLYIGPKGNGHGTVVAQTIILQSGATVAAGATSILGLITPDTSAWLSSHYLDQPVLLSCDTAYTGGSGVVKVRVTYYVLDWS